MSELLCRHEIGLLPAGAQTNKLIVREGLFYMYYVILVTTGQYKTRTAVGRPHLVRSPRYIPESVFYTQSVMLSPRFMPQSAVRSPQSAVRSPCFIVTGNLRFWTVLNRHKRCLFRRYARRRAFITKSRTIILFTNTTLNRLGFRETAIEHILRSEI